MGAGMTKSSANGRGGKQGNGDPGPEATPSPAQVLELLESNLFPALLGSHLMG